MRLSKENIWTKMISRFLGRECSISEQKVRKQIRSTSFDIRNNRRGKHPSVKVTLNIKAYKKIEIKAAGIYYILYKWRWEHTIYLYWTRKETFDTKKFGVSVQIFTATRIVTILWRLSYQYNNFVVCTFTCDDVVDAVFTFLVYGCPISGAVW